MDRFEISHAKLDLAVPRAYGETTKMKKALLGLLDDNKSYWEDQPDEAVRDAWYKRKKKDGRYELSQSQGETLLAQLHGGVRSSNWRRELHALASGDVQTSTLNSGCAGRAEIEIVGQSCDNLITPEHGVVQSYVEVYVDKVRFRMREEQTSQVRVSEGHYIRITPPDPVKHPGVVILPVAHSPGEVLLVRQYRHPQRAFLTEIPRGFGCLGDSDKFNAAARELREETAAEPRRRVDGHQELEFLKAVCTDTGKLVEAPDYFLAIVDRQLQEQEINRVEPTMEDPLWVSLDTFYEAIFHEVWLKEGEYSHALNPERRSQLNSPHDFQEEPLVISDAFSINAAMLALPRLARRFPDRVSPEFLRRLSTWG